MIKRRSRRRANWATIPCLCGLTMGLLTPVGLRAQSPETGMNALDEWRHGFAQRLDHDLARLGAGTRNDPASASLRAESRAEEKRETETSLPTWPSARPAKPTLSAIEKILAAHGLPAALQGIPAVESGFDPAALSPKGARGLWQLMPGTARQYGLVVDGRSDERLEPRKSTYVAARYLSDLYAQFHDWLLVLAAYNAGEGRVQDAIERFGTRDFWTLSRRLALPEETRRYVPAVLGKAGGWRGARRDAPLARAHGSFRLGPILGIAPEPKAVRVVYALTSPAPVPAPRRNNPEDSP